MAVGSRSEKDGTCDSLIGGAFVRRAASTLASRRCAARDGGVFFAPPLLRGGPGDPNGGGGEGGGVPRRGLVWRTTSGVVCGAARASGGLRGGGYGDAWHQWLLPGRRYGA
jgi:hypothetical protein